MNAISPIEAFLNGQLREDELLAEVDRVIARGSESDRTALLNDWRTKSGKIRTAETRRKLDSKVQAFSWVIPEETTTNPRAPIASSRPLQAGDVLASRFVIESRIGSGGMGTVFKARDLRREEAQDRNPYVAVKTLNVDVLQRDDSLKILQREARKAQALSHPNIVRVYDFDRDGGTLFITMELLEGVSLDEVIAKNGTQGASLVSLMPILKQVVSALQFAHMEGIVHSDLKPANIIVLPNGRVKVIDFGISRAIPKPNQQTVDQTTFNIGALGAMTPAYASPEMIEGLDPDPRDDVFALACIIYEYLTGRHPFGRVPATEARAGGFKPRQPASLSSDQWRALESGLCFDRSGRTGSPDQLVADLAIRAPGAYPRYRRILAPMALTLSAVAIASVLGAYFAGGRWLGHFGAEDQSQPTPMGPTRAIVPSDRTAGQTQQQATQETTQRQVQQQVSEEAAQQKTGEEVKQRQEQLQAAEEAARRQQPPPAREDAAEQQAPPVVGGEAKQKEEQQPAAEEATQQQRSNEEKAAQKQEQQPAAEEATRLAQPQAAPNTPQLTVDQIGPSQIAEAQRLLASMGLNTGASDGRIGPRTQEMITAYQLSVGEPATGQLTTTLLNSLRRTSPPTAARAKSLFTMAAAARKAERFGDAIRLYEAALKLAPNDPDGTLALGDLRRDRQDFDAARHLYEMLERSRGPAADIARERLAHLPSPVETPTPQTTNKPQVLTHDESGGQQAISTTPGNAYDGTYTGVRQIVGFGNPNCPSNSSVTIVVRENKLSFENDVKTTVAGDGSFNSYSSIGGRIPISQHLTGRIQNNRIEADTMNPFCNYHMSLKKTG
jgi:tetratricopeptide (TPR) repeat protein/predicted Ser/Thr protein kinase